MPRSDQRISFSASEKNSVPPKLPDFKCKQHVTLVGTDGAQNRHACSDFCAYEESGNAQAIDHGA